MVAAILNLKKCTRGIFGASSEFVWGDVHVSFLKKSAFCNFIPGSCVFYTNALALNEFCHVVRYTYDKALTLSARDRLYTSESDVYSRQTLTYKDDPRTERIKICIMTVVP